MRNNLARFRTSGGGRRRGDSHNRRRSLRRRRRNGTCRRAALAGFRFLFLLLGQNGLHHVAGLRHVREIDFGSDGLGPARRYGAAMARRFRSALKLRANLFSLMLFYRAGVGLALAQAELSQHVKNLTALYFHLAREIVNSNLAHPPLFRMCYPKPLVAHSYLMALAC